MISAGSPEHSQGPDILARQAKKEGRRGRGRQAKKEGRRERGEDRARKK